MTLSLLEPKQDQLGRDLTLINWAAYDLPAHGMESGMPRVFVGLLQGHGRMPWVSEPFYSFNALEAMGKTCEGRVVRLLGMPCFNAAAAQAWTDWKRMHRVRDTVDVSDEVLRSILDANRMAEGSNLRQFRMRGRES